MKSKDLEKLYKVLTSKEQAIMTFEALVKGDTKTANQICGSVPRHNYRCIDTGYSATLASLFEVASLWAILYWQAYAKMLATVGASIVASKDKELERVKTLDDLQYIWEQRLIALGVILGSLGKSHGIDTNTITHFADAKLVFGLDHPIESLTGDALEYYENHLALFTALIDDEEASADVWEYFNREGAEKK